MLSPMVFTWLHANVLRRGNIPRWTHIRCKRIPEIVEVIKLFPDIPVMRTDFSVFRERLVRPCSVRNITQFIRTRSGAGTLVNLSTTMPEYTKDFLMADILLLARADLSGLAIESRADFSGYRL
jgi:hypothetical protein